jgi:hypothetical protein
MSKKQWIVLILILGIYPACKWDYYLSNYLFEQYCTDPDRIGLFVYEKAQLGDEYFMPFPKDKEPRDLDPRFIFGENLMINRERFDEDFIFNVYKKVPISSIGPINAEETSVIRKSDQKVLGKAVSAANAQGWLNQFGLIGGFPGVYCPAGRDENHFPRSRLAHYALVKETFTYQAQGE